MEFFRNIVSGGEHKREQERERLRQLEAAEQRRQEIIGAFKKIIETIQRVKTNQRITSKEQQTLQLLLTGYIRGNNRTWGNEFSVGYNDINSYHQDKTLAVEMIEALRLTRQIPGFEKLVDESLVSLCNTYDSTFDPSMQHVTKPYFDNRRTPEATWKGEGVIAREAYRAQKNYLDS